jgi:wyosine [tRNA(Phe)-imidazoG37] synthetase (radical SAM superfamily)
MKTLPFDRIQADPDWVTIDWTMSNVCNYACEYCPTITHNGSSGWPTLESVDYTTKILQEHYGKTRNLEYILLGGELAMWKKLPDALDIIKQNSPTSNIKFITNGIMPEDYWRRIGKQITSVVFSYHPTQVKSVERFVESVNALDNEYKTILVLAWPSVWDKVVAARQYILENVKEFTSLELKLVDNRYETIADSKVVYTQEQMDFIQANRKVSKSKKSVYKPSFTYNDNKKLQEVTGQILVDGQNKFKDWSCGIGVDKITLDANGTIRRGSGCMIGTEEDFGNWKDLDIKNLPKDGVICPYNTCWCMPDLMATKSKGEQ